MTSEFSVKDNWEIVVPLLKRGKSNYKPWFGRDDAVVCLMAE